MSRERITHVRFVHGVAFAGLLDVIEWSVIDHGPLVAEGGRKRPTNVSIGQGVVTIRPVGTGGGVYTRTVRVPLTNVSYWHVETDEEPAAEPPR